MSAIPAPRARPLVIGLCPYCAGKGEQPGPTFEADGAMVKCERCNGHGDLDEMRLVTAYHLGREDAIKEVMAHLGDLRVMASLAIDAAEHGPPAASYEQIRARIGG